ncbi:MAG: hypothetical protein IJA34_03470 [Lachnospiraceae bacterium]|nr:hypothetical protein [Lachnospiraceae bacterium]
MKKINHKFVGIVFLCGALAEIILGICDKSISTIIFGVLFGFMGVLYYTDNYTNNKK